MLSACVAAVALTACSDVGNDAARVGNAELGSSEFRTWLDDVAGAQPTTFLAPSGAISATAARELLTRWVTAEVITRVVESEGGEVTDEDRATALEQIEANGTYVGASDESLEKIAELEAAIIALDRTVTFDENDAAELYAAGAEKAGVVCARAIISESSQDIDVALARLGDGEKFARVANDVNPPGNLGPGGAVLDETGSECIALGPFTAGVAPAVAEAVLGAQVGTPTDVIDLGGAYAVIVLRPFDEVADAATPVMAGSAARTAGRNALQSSNDIEVASRFGRWDPEQMAVVALG
jgi:hypothetical protein